MDLDVGRLAKLLAPLTRFLPLTEIERKRLLPVPARLLVRRGQSVTAEDVVAESLTQTRHLLLDAARALGISSKRAEAQITCKTNMSVSVGDILAGPIGLARRVLRAPQNGKVVIIYDGKILLELEGLPERCLAGLPGEVVELIPDAGAVIRTVGGLIQGAWGNGKLGSGKLAMPGGDQDRELSPGLLADIGENEIIAGGWIADPRVFAVAANLPIKGLIIGSLAPGLVELAWKADLPVLVVDGFGKSAMNSAAWRVLSGLVGNSMTINSTGWNRRSGERPEAVVPLPGSSTSPPPARFELFMPGQVVRTLGLQDPGVVGTLVDLVGEYLFPSGFHSEAARLKLEDGSELTVPLVNLERLA